MSAPQHRIIAILRGRLYGGGPTLVVGLALVSGLDFTSHLHGKSQSSLPGLTTFILPRNPETDIYIQVFIL